MIGDKETFWIASELSSAPYHFLGSYSSVLGKLPRSLDYKPLSPHTPLPYIPPEICSVQILHLDSQRRPFWFNGSLRENKLIRDDLGEFTGWMDGGETWEKQLQWRYNQDNIWCAELEGGEVQRLNGTKFNEVLEQSIKDAKELDKQFLKKD